MLGQYDRSQGTGISGNSTLADALGKHESGVDSFMSFTTSYKDTGLTGLYFTSEPVKFPSFIIFSKIRTKFRKLYLIWLNSFVGNGENFVILKMSNVWNMQKGLCLRIRY